VLVAASARASAALFATLRVLVPGSVWTLVAESVTASVLVAASPRPSEAAFATASVDVDRSADGVPRHCRPR
jgi:hypothetical protein